MRQIRQPQQTDYPLPPELGGTKTIYPVISTMTAPMLREVRLSWYGPTGPCGGLYQWFPYTGQVQSIQLTARPGYYVAPDVMAALGLGDLGGGPNG